MLDDIIKERLKKLEALKKAGREVYPARVKRTRLIAEVLEKFAALSKSREKVFLTGRIIGLRNQGSIVFADLKDGSDEKIQSVIKKDNVKDFKLFKENLDIGDFIEASGPVFKTKIGERSVEVKSLRVIVKSLRPLPSVWHGLKDVEERFRKRYLDLILNPEVKEKLITRSKIIELLREYLFNEGFLEVETPILQPIPGGALARPFVTHHNALDVDFYLRIAPELYLKRLLVGGLEKIFEIGKNFRNEGMDREHNPEVTMIELYWAYQDYWGLMKFTNKLLVSLARKLKIKNLIYQGQKINFLGHWAIITYADALKQYGNVDIKKLKTEEIDEAFKKFVRPKIINPTFVINHPKAISPLAKSLPDDPSLTERFQLLVAGFELVNGFSELNDPIDQRERMEKQGKMRKAGNLEASRLDEDFLEALEYGMPPTAGLGIGIDRLAALLTDSHAVKEIMFFPTIRPK